MPPGTITPEPTPEPTPCTTAHRCGGAKPVGWAIWENSSGCAGLHPEEDLEREEEAKKIVVTQ